MAQLTIIVQNYEHGSRTVKIAAMAGAADSSNVADIDKVVLSLIEEVTSSLDLIIDGTDLEYVNSTWIGHLTDWYRRIEAQGGQLLLVSLRPNVYDTLSVVGLLHLIPHYPNLAEAKLALVETGATHVQPSIALTV